MLPLTVRQVRPSRICNLFRSSVLCGALSVFAACVPGMAQADTKVIGYIPSYKNMPSVIDRTDLSKLTHINISFLNPNSGGAVTSGGNPVCMDGGTGDHIRYVVQKAHAAGVKVLVSLAGGVIPGCSGNWETLLQSGSRTTLVNNLIQMVNDYGLDGLDVDIEGVLLTNIDNAGNYTPFIQALRNGLPAGKLLTSATASYVGGMVPTSSLQYFDFVNIMSYDNVGPGWGQAGTEHASYDQAVGHINTWKARGLSKDKLVLGVPFYGYGFGSYASSYSFADIINQFGAAAGQQDLIGNLCVGCSYVTYNGIPTIRKKTRLGLQEGTGIMIWELSQDATASNSLLTAIRDEISIIGGGNSSSAASSIVSSVAASSTSSVASSLSSSVAAGQQCNWWGSIFAICTRISTGWGWENDKDCVGINTCATLSPPYGVIGSVASSSIAVSSVASSIVNSSPKSSSAPSSVMVSSSRSSVASSSVASTGAKQCNWWGTYYAICTSISLGWSWENGKDCVGEATCAALAPPYGIVGGGGSSISSSSLPSSSAVSSSKPSSSVISSSKPSSSSSSVSVDVTPPSVPQSLRSTAQSDNSITLEWNASSDNVGVAGYVVTYAFGTTTVNTTATSLVITGLSANTAYTFTVKAKDLAGNSSAETAGLQVSTKPVSDVVKATGVPGFPHLSHQNWTGESNFTLTQTMWWGNNGSSWEVYENGALIYTAPLTDDSPNQQNANYQVTGKANGSYTYYSKLINKFGSSKSDAVTINVTKGGAGDVIPPTAPQSLVLSGKTSTSVSLSWTAATDNVAVTGYVIDGGASQVTVTGTSATVNGLSASTNYTFSVRAKDAAGNLSTASNSLMVTTSPNVVDTTPPTAPLNLVSTQITSSTIDLSWNSSTDNIGVTGYIVYYGATSVSVTTTSASIVNLASNTNYTFTVKAVDGSGNLSLASNSLTVKTLPFNGVEPAQLLFDDFTYNTPDDTAFLDNWKASDYSPAAPGVGSFSKNNVVFFAEPGNAANKQMRIMFKTKGARENTIQGEVEGQKRFLYGTYATRMRFYNQPIEGPSQVVGPETGDRMIATFFTISPYYVPNTEYGELDFEYLPNAGWNPDEGGRFTGPTMWNTTWKNRDTRITKPWALDASGWHTFWMTVTPTAVTYYMDDRLLVQHTNVDYIPKTTMYLMWNLWISGESFAAGQNGVERTWAQDVDWVYYAKDTTLTRADVEGFVGQYKAQNIQKRDTLPPPN